MTRRDDLRKQALANLQSFYSEAEISHGQLDTLRQSSELASESVRLTNLRYQGGEATALEVVDARWLSVTRRRTLYEPGVRYVKVGLATVESP